MVCVQSWVLLAERDSLARPNLKLGSYKFCPGAVVDRWSLLCRAVFNYSIIAGTNKS